MGLLVNYDIESYGETAPFYLPDSVILSGRIDDRRNRSGMPKEYVYKTGRDFDWTKYTEDIESQKKIANAFSIRFDMFRKQGRGLYIYSDTKGSGKTMLACCVSNEILKRHDIPVKFISMAEYIELVKEKGEGAQEKRKTILDSVLLIVDDIGGLSENKDWISDAIFRLVDRRHTNLLPTIYTSNRRIDELKCDDRVKDRIYEDSIQIKMPEMSIRRMKADQMTKEFLSQVLGAEENN